MWLRCSSWVLPPLSVVAMGGTRWARVIRPPLVAPLAPTMPLGTTPSRAIRALLFCPTITSPSPCPLFLSRPPRCANVGTQVVGRWSVVRPIGTTDVVTSMAFVAMGKSWALLVLRTISSLPCGISSFSLVEASRHDACESRADLRTQVSVWVAMSTMFN